MTASKKFMMKVFERYKGDAFRLEGLVQECFDAMDGKAFDDLAGEYGWIDDEIMEKVHKR